MGVIGFITSIVELWQRLDGEGSWHSGLRLTRLLYGIRTVKSVNWWLNGDQLPMNAYYICAE